MTPFPQPTAAAAGGNASAAMPPPVGVPVHKAGGAAPVPNTNETDEPPNSSPARSSAAMALASMFHIKPGQCTIEFQTDWENAFRIQIRGN